MTSSHHNIGIVCFSTFIITCYIFILFCHYYFPSLAFYSVSQNFHWHYQIQPFQPQQEALFLTGTETSKILARTQTLNLFGISGLAYATINDRNKRKYSHITINQGTATKHSSSCVSSSNNDDIPSFSLLDRIDRFLLPILFNNSSILDPIQILMRIDNDHTKDWKDALKEASIIPMELHDASSIASDVEVTQSSLGQRRINLIQYDMIRTATTLPTTTTDDTGNLMEGTPFVEKRRKYVETRATQSEKSSLVPPFLSLRTKKSTPLLSKQEVQLLKSTAESYWKTCDSVSNTLSSSSSAAESVVANPVSSRFTYQRKGNREAHLVDIVKHSQSESTRNFISKSSTSKRKVDAAATATTATTDFHQQHQQPSSNVTELVQNLLLHRVYPWIREAFLSKEESINANTSSELYVYDALFIRYNATEALWREKEVVMDNVNAATEHNRDRRQGTGAGQPLHRDLGYVTVNIMLSDPFEFQGGGTFFENQLLFALEDSTPHHLFINSTSSYFYKSSSVPLAVEPLQPLGLGHALAHYSSERHAGASTWKGVRDILVIFLAVSNTAETYNPFEEVCYFHSESPKLLPKVLKSSTTFFDMESVNIHGRKLAPRWERAARLKSTAQSYCYDHCACENGNNMRKESLILCQVLHHRLAIDEVLCDGEAWHFLGMALLEYFKNMATSPSSTFVTNNECDSYTVLDLAVNCLEEAEKHTPCDARLYNNRGIALERALSICEDTTIQAQEVCQQLHNEIISAYHRAINLHSFCEQSGCDVRSDYKRACLNFGLYLSKCDDFQSAIDVLSLVVNGRQDQSYKIASTEDAISHDILRLMSFCKKRVDF